jgi:hypothetical protein
MLARDATDFSEDFDRRGIRFLTCTRGLRDGGREGVEVGRQISENSFGEISDNFQRNLGRPSGHETVF